IDGIEAALSHQYKGDARRLGSVSREAARYVCVLGRAAQSNRRREVIGLIALLYAATATAQVSGPAYFSERVYPVLEAAQCRLCHVRDGVASGTRVRFPEKEASAAEIQSFGLSLAAVVNKNKPQESLLAVKPTNRIQHTGGERIKPGSDEEKL